MCLFKRFKKRKAEDQDPKDQQAAQNTKENFEIDYDNLAIPEVHTGSVDHNNSAQSSNETSSEFQAIPEYHPRRNK